MVNESYVIVLGLVSDEWYLLDLVNVSLARIHLVIYLEPMKPHKCPVVPMKIRRLTSQAPISSNDDTC